jgi:hypothetical protein
MVTLLPWLSYHDIKADVLGGFDFGVLSLETASRQKSYRSVEHSHLRSSFIHLPVIRKGRIRRSIDIKNFHLQDIVRVINMISISGSESWIPCAAERALPNTGITD